MALDRPAEDDMPARSWRALPRRVGAIAAAALIGPLALTAVTDSASAAGYARSSTGATVAGVKWVKKGSQFDFTINSKALGGKYSVRVLVPKSWKRTAKRTWPVLYA